MSPCSGTQAVGEATSGTLPNAVHRAKAMWLIARLMSLLTLHCQNKLHGYAAFKEYREENQNLCRKL